MNQYVMRMPMRMCLPRLHGCYPSYFTLLLVISCNLQLPMALYLHAVFSIITFILWCYITFTNPTKPGGFPCPCMKFTQHGPARLSHETHRMIPGYDHFCVWLNQVCASDAYLQALPGVELHPSFGRLTLDYSPSLPPHWHHQDIGRRNYWAFYTLAVAATCMSVVQVVFPAIWFVNHWASQSVLQQVACILCGVMGMIGVAAFGSLLGFHTYLLTQGLGTYDWLMRRFDLQQSTAQRVQFQASADNTATHIPIVFDGARAGAVTPADQADISAARINSGDLCHLPSSLPSMELPQMVTTTPGPLPLSNSVRMGVSPSGRVGTGSRSSASHHSRYGVGTRATTVSCDSLEIIDPAPDRLPVLEDSTSIHDEQSMDGSESA